MSGTLGPRVPVTPQVNDGTDLTSLLNPQPQTTGGINLPPIGSAASTQSVTTTPNVQQVKTPSSSQTPPPPTTPVNNSIGTQQAQSIAAGLLQPGGGLQNPLNSYFQVQPVFKFYMTGDNDPLAAAATNGAASGGATTAQIYQALDSMPQVVLAQTGVTGYNIKSVEIESAIAPNEKTRMSNDSLITMTITESMGVGFQESILAAAIQLSVRNHLKSYFYLEMHFVAYDTNGNFVQNPVQALGIENRWIWQLAIRDIDVHIDAGGGTYTLAMVPFADLAYNQEIFLVPHKLTTSGGTLGQFTTNFADALTKSWIARYNNTVTTYAFQWHKLSETLQGTFASGFDDPTKFSTSFTSPDFSSIEGLDFSVINGVPNFVLQPGASIADFLNSVIMNCEACQKLGIDDPSIGQVPGAAPGFRKVVCWRIEPDVKLTAYEAYTQQYYKTITYHIRPYYTQLPIIDSQQSEVAAKPGVSFQALQDLVNQNLVQKRYDYIYSGLNIDVIDFDIHYNFQWNAIISKYAGALTNSDMLRPSARVSSSNTINSGVALQQSSQQLLASKINLAQQAQTNLTNAQTAQSAAQDKVSSLTAQIIGKDTGPSTGTASQQQQLAAAQADLTKQNNAVTTAQTANLQALSQTSVPLSSVIKNGGSTIYAEALITQPAATTSTTSVSTISPTQISTVQAFRDADDQAGTGTRQSINNDRSVFSAVMGQLNAPTSQTFYQIDIGVRGDPFWLGQTNLIRLSEMRGGSPPASNKNIPDWYIGNNCFLLHFRAPIGYGSDFAPDFRDSLVFNGVYMVSRIKHIFGGNDGFKQELTGLRLPLINTADAATNQGTPTSTTHATDQNGNPAPGSGGASANPNPGTTGASPDWYNSPQAAPYKSTIDAAAAKYGVPPQLLAWQIGQESSFNTNPSTSNTTSSGVPTGIAQFTTGTAGSVPGYGPLDPTDPNASIMAAAAYDQHLYQSNGSWQGALTQYGTLSGNPSQSTWNGFNNALSASGLPPGS
jgi:hypothetical protein